MAERTLLTYAERLSKIAQKRECIPWQGRPSEYQGEAKAMIAYKLGAGSEVPWIYVVPLCGTPLCIERMHIRAFNAKRIAYPTYVCIYCGLPGYTKDHLLPVTMTGEAVRKFVAVVPACKECNSGIGDRCGHRVTERRGEAHRLIARKHRKLLDMPKLWSPDQMSGLGPNLRSHIRKSMAQRDVVLARLAWPDDPDYDRRAFERSGFDDPVAMELL